MEKIATQNSAQNDAYYIEQIEKLQSQMDVAFKRIESNLSETEETFRRIERLRAAERERR